VFDNMGFVFDNLFSVHYCQHKVVGCCYNVYGAFNAINSMITRCIGNERNHPIRTK